MSGLERGDIVLDHAAQAHNFDRVRAQGFLVVVSKRDEKEKPCQKRDDNDADSGSRQQLEMKMLRTEKPRKAVAENASGGHEVTQLRSGRRLRREVWSERASTDHFLSQRRSLARGEWAAVL